MIAARLELSGCGALPEVPLLVSQGIDGIPVGIDGLRPASLRVAPALVLVSVGGPEREEGHGCKEQGGHRSRHGSSSVAILATSGARIIPASLHLTSLFTYVSK